MAAVTENLDPNLSFASNDAGAGGRGRPPPAKKGVLRVSISPKKPDTYLVSPGGSGAASSRTRSRHRRRSSSHFGAKKKKMEACYNAEDDDDSDEEEDDDEESDIEFTLDGATDIDGADSTPNNASEGASGGAVKRKAAKKPGGQRRRRRSSARFLRLSAGGNDAAAAAAEEDSSPGSGDFTSSEHLGEIYRQAIRMNAENKINAGNSWGLKLIENMDKFIVEDGSDEVDGDKGAREQLREARKMKSKDVRGRVNFAKASCTLDASVKIYSYRVDDVHLSSYRVLANLNRTDNKKDNRASVEEEGGTEEGGADGGKAVKRRAGPRGTTETLESNMANINMSKLDSAYDIDPLFHKMSKSFDEGGAKGLLLGNLGVSQHGCHIVFDSKDEGGAGGGAGKLDVIEEAEKVDEKQRDDEENDFKIDPEEAVVWKESEIDITNLASKLSSILSSYGHRSSSSVPFVPQLESLRLDYAALEEEGYAVDEREAARAAGRRRLRLYDAPEEEEKEAEKSIHVIAMERSRGSVLGMSFDTNFRLSMGDLGDDDAGGEFGDEDFGGEGEFAPAADDGGFSGYDGGFEPDFGGDGGFDDGDDPRPTGGGGTFVDARSYNNTRVLLDALCSGDAFYEGGAGGNGDYAFFDMKKFEKATDGNLWAGSQHWKKKPASARGKDKCVEKKRVMFDDDGEEEKKAKKRATKKDRVFIDFMNAPDVDAIFEKKKTTKRARKSKRDSYQMPQTEKDFLLPPDANVDILQLTRLFSRPNAVVRRKTNGKNEKPVGKTVGFYDVEDNALGFDDEGDDGDFADNDDGGFTFAYGEEDGQGRLGSDIDHDVDYNLDNFGDVRKVEKINIAYATVAKKVDVRRLKKDLWAELEARTSRVEPETFPDENEGTPVDDEKKKQEEQKGEQKYVSFKETVDKMDMSQSQNDVTVSFYFICCLHLANEKGLKLDAFGLEDFMISLDDGSAPTFGTFGDGFTETANKLSSGAVASAINSRGQRQTKVTSYVEEDDEDEDDMDFEEE